MCFYSDCKSVKTSHHIHLKTWVLMQVQNRQLFRASTTWQLMALWTPPQWMCGPISGTGILSGSGHPCMGDEWAPGLSAPWERVTNFPACHFTIISRAQEADLISGHHLTLFLLKKKGFFAARLRREGQEWMPTSTLSWLSGQVAH